MPEFRPDSSVDFGIVKLGATMGRQLSLLDTGDWQLSATRIEITGDKYGEFGFLKNGNIKRILTPFVGTTQAVQSVGSTPNGRPMRAMAFVGNELYLGSSDSLSSGASFGRFATSCASNWGKPPPEMTATFTTFSSFPRSADSSLR